jgi:hypothetical protein
MGNATKLRAMFLAGLTAAATSGCVVDAAPESVKASVKADQAVGKIRHQVDEARGRIWVLTRSGVAVIDLASPRPIRRVPLPGWVWAGEPFGCLPDIAIGPKGEALVSSDVVPTLWRVDPDTLEVSEHALALDADTDKDIGFSELQYSAEQNAYFGVATFYGSVWRIDPLLGRAQKVAQAAPQARVCRTGATARRALPPELAYRH